MKPVFGVKVTKMSVLVSLRSKYAKLSHDGKDYQTKLERLNKAEIYLKIFYFTLGILPWKCELPSLKHCICSPNKHALLNVDLSHKYNYDFLNIF